VAVEGGGGKSAKKQKGGRVLKRSGEDKEIYWQLGEKEFLRLLPKGIKKG